MLTEVISVLRQQQDAMCVPEPLKRAHALHALAMEGTYGATAPSGFLWSMECIRIQNVGFHGARLAGFVCRRAKSSRRDDA